MGWTRTRGIGAGDRDRDGDRDRVRDRDRIHLVALKQPDPGRRTPDPGNRTPDPGPDGPFFGGLPHGPRSTRRGMKMLWTRRRGIGAGDRDRDGDRDRIHLVALKQPDPGLRTPDPGSRTGSDTATVTATVTDTDTGWMEPVTGVPTVPFSGDSTRTDWFRPPWLRGSRPRTGRRPPGGTDSRRDPSARCGRPWSRPVPRSAPGPRPSETRG